jgi:hypothetical protein
MKSRDFAERSVPVAMTTWASAHRRPPLNLGMMGRPKLGQSHDLRNHLCGLRHGFARSPTETLRRRKRFGNRPAEINKT